MSDIVPGDIVLARETSGQYHAVVRGLRLGRLTVERCDGRPGRPVALRDVLAVYKPAGRPDGMLGPERLRPTAQLRMDLDPPGPMSRGLVALGDSITYGEGGIVLGVDGRSWALWLAMALDLPYTTYAVAGVDVDHVVRVQLPRVRDDHDLACLYVGVNDVRSVAWDAAAYERGLRTAVETLCARARRVLLCTAPLDLGRPPAGAKVADLNAIVRATAAGHGAAVASLDDLRGWRLVLPDAVHPTALGQLEIADRAARALGAAVRPSALVDVDDTRLGLARFARGYAGDAARDLVRRAVERRRYAA